MKAMLRSKEGTVFEGEFVRMVELPGLRDYLFGLTIPDPGVFTISELTTGLALGIGHCEDCALDDARKELIFRGRDAVVNQIAKRLAEFGPLPVSGEAA